MSDDIVLSVYILCSNLQPLIVEIPRSLLVGFFIDAVLEKSAKCHNLLEGISADRILLYKAEFLPEDDNYEKPARSSRKELMHSYKRVSSYFKGELSETVHLIMEVENRASILAAASRARAEIVPLPVLDHRRRTLGAPKSKTFNIDSFEGVEDIHHHLFMGRAYNRYGLPVALYHRALATLQHNLDTLESQAKMVRCSQSLKDNAGGYIGIDDQDLSEARDFYTRSCYTYKDESKRRPLVEEFFKHKLGDAESLMEEKLSGTAEVDENVWGKCAVLEIKNESGIGGDASLQSAWFYFKHCASLQENLEKLPAILLGVMGNVIEISIAVCLEQFLVNKIYRLELSLDDKDNEQVAQLALIGSVLESCAKQLRDEYNEYNDSEIRDQTSGRETWHLPNPTIDPSLNIAGLSLKFKSKLNRANKDPVEEATPNMRSLFLADYTAKEWTEPREVVVKFAATYDEESHRLMAKNGYAPELYACVPVIGRRLMVVMERVKGVRMCDYPDGLPESTFDELRKAMNILHDSEPGFVFGDLRDTNIMVERGEDGEYAGVKLVDFDLAGKSGTAVYPALINKKLIGVELSPEVYALGLVEKKHDDYALDRVEKKYLKRLSW